jgi:uncharacterized protein YerC
MKRKRNDLSREEYVHTLDLLYTAASAVKGRDGIKLFLRDLLTSSERIMLGRRIWIARLLISGETHASIAQKLNVGLSTVWRVQRWLRDEYPGYEQALRGLEKEMDKRAIWKEIKDNPFSYAALKKKYPVHFLLFPEPKPKKKYRS